MINVIEYNLGCKYIDSYWLNNIIIDQSKNKNKEKLNNKYEIEIDIDNNEFNKKYNIRNTDTDKSNDARNDTGKETRSDTRKYIKNNNRERHRKQDTHNRMYDKEESCEYRIFQECSRTNKNKGKMHDVSEKCRVYEYQSRERKVLLDSFSKSELTSKNKIKEKLK